MTHDALLPFRPGVDGAFDFDDAAHLLRRAGFGETPSECRAATKRGLEATLALMLAPCEPAESASTQEALRIGDRCAARGDIEGLEAAWILRFVTSPRPLIENLVLFWHDHFATSAEKIRDAALMHRQHRLFIEGAAGRFPWLLHEVAKDPAMIAWLDNDTNDKVHPNENFARELFELFTLGLGHYSEADIREAARAFTGWRTKSGAFHLDANSHDDAEKTIFGKAGRFGGEAVIDLALSRSECPRFIAAKLYRWFVHPSPDESILDAAGALLTELDFDIWRFVIRLLGSRIFFDPSSRGTLVRSPMAFVVGALRSIAARAKPSALARHVARMGQRLFHPPSVAGWDGGDAWLDSSALVARLNFASEIAEGRRGALDVTIDADEIDVADLSRVMLVLEPDRDRLHVATESRDVRAALGSLLALAAAQVY